jgi:alpha-tubulin suppressor-like RCC1 family protein
LPTLVEGLHGVCGVSADGRLSLAVTSSGDVFGWGEPVDPEAEDEESELRPVVVEGFGGMRMRSVCASVGLAFAIGEAGQFYSWGRGEHGRLGHGNEQDQSTPKRVEALRDVRVSCVSVGWHHAIALTEDGLVYAWGEHLGRSLLGNPNAERELLPKPVEALRGVRVGSIAAAAFRSYAVADTGEV